MGLWFKIIFTIVFAGLAAASAFIDSKDPGRRMLWFGNKRLLETITDGDRLKRWTKPIAIFISFLFFGACILLVWLGE